MQAFMTETQINACAEVCTNTSAVESEPIVLKFDQLCEHPQPRNPFFCVFVRTAAQIAISGCFFAVLDCSLNYFESGRSVA